jgi:hypothetical protein
MRLFWTVSDPHQYPRPSTHGALAGAWELLSNVVDELA